MKDWEDVKREMDEYWGAPGVVGFYRRSVVDRYRRYRIRVLDVPRDIRYAYQRVVRGWDDRSLWSLDVALSRQLGEQLTRMADIAHGWPDCSDWDYTFESWVSTLRKHGQALTLYSEGWTEDWASTGVPAQEALQWVSVHLGALWD